MTLDALTTIQRGIRLNLEARNGLIDSLLGECLETLLTKGAAYSGDIDANSNFKRNAERLGMTKYQVLMVYMNKHFDGINNAIRANPEYPEEKTEGMKGRILDAINYLCILHTLIEEDKIAK